MRWSAILEYCDPSNIKNIKENSNNIQKHGMEQKVATLFNTYESIKLLHWGLNHLKRNVLHYCDLEVNLLSYMTLELEHVHSTCNHRQGFQVMLQPARLFSASIKKSIKFMTQWNAYNFTRNTTGIWKYTWKYA